MSAYRNLASVIAALTIMGVATAGMTALVPLILGPAGVGAFVIGVVASTYAAGFLLGAVVSTQVVRELGHIRAFALGASLAATATLSLGLNDDPLWWGLLRFFTGASVALLFAAGESWIADAAPAERRGGVLGFYLVVSKFGQVIGPFAVAAAASGDRGLMIAGAAFALCLAPIAATRRSQPALPSAEPFGPKELWGAAPASVLAAAAAGLVNGAVMALYPLYAASLTAEQPGATAAAFNAAFVIGSVVAQWPAGLASDRVDRRLVIAALASIAAGAALILAVAPFAQSVGLAVVLSAIWGAGSLSFYGLGVAHAADRVGPGRTTRALAGLLIVWGAGAAIGPVAAGVVMASPLGPSGLFVFAAVLLLVLALAMLRRRAIEAPPAPADKSVFAPVLATSMANGDLAKGDASKDASASTDASGARERGSVQEPPLHE